MMRHLLWILTVMIFFAISCSDPGEDENNGGGSSNSGANTFAITLLSGELDTAGALPTSRFKVSAENCTLANGDVNASGTCFTPLSISAKVSQIDLTSSYGGDNGGARLIQFSAAPDDDPFAGPQGVLGLETYDFSTSARATNPYSEESVQESAYYYDSVVATLASIDMQMEVEADSSTPFWTVRYVFYPQNPLDESAVASCAPDNPSLNSALQSDGDLFSAPEGFERGDILVCQKANQTDTCADSDFQFVATDGSLSGTRPSNPLQLSGEYLWEGEENDCNSDNGNISLEMQQVRFQTALPSGSHVKIYKSRDAEACFYQYTFNATCTATSATDGSCSGSDTVAFGVDFEVDFDMTESVFIPSGLDPDSDATTDTLSQLDQVLPRPIYFENYKSNMGSGYTSGIEANVTITANNDNLTTAFTTLGLDSSDYDEDYCFIENQ